MSFESYLLYCKGLIQQDQDFKARLNVPRTQYIHWIYSFTLHLYFKYKPCIPDDNTNILMGFFFTTLTYMRAGVVRQIREIVAQEASYGASAQDEPAVK